MQRAKGHCRERAVTGARASVLEYRRLLRGDAAGGAGGMLLDCALRPLSGNIQGFPTAIPNKKLDGKGALATVGNGLESSTAFHKRWRLSTSVSIWVSAFSTCPCFLEVYLVNPRKWYINQHG